MGSKFQLIRLPIVLLIIFFLGKLIGGFAGMSYEAATQVFAMVPLTIHLCLVWGALSRPVFRQGLGGALILGALIAVVAQILIFGATFLSYVTGVETHFSNSVAIVREVREVSFGEAMLQRTIGVVVNAILGAIAALIGYALGRFVQTPAQS